MLGIVLVLYESISFLNFCEGVQINYITVPGAVQNNSDVPVILDCNYSVRPDDQELVVKWFLDGDIVYQWIPGQLPQSLGMMKDRLDITYKATDDPKTAFRAMKIVNVTSDIAGEYKCFVSTFADEDYSSKKLTVFEPEHELLLFQMRPNEESVNFTCMATEVYPQPKLMIYRDNKNDVQNKKPVEGVEWNVRKHPNGRFTVYTVATSKISMLEPGSLINCELKIFGTGYVKRKTLLYYPENFDDDKACSKQSSFLLMLVGINVLFIFV